MKHFEEHSHTYQTGRTQPPKSHQGLVAVLLIAVILTAGTVTILGLMNVQLHHISEKQEPVRFSEESSGIATLSLEQEPDGVFAPALGIKGQEFTSLYRSYQAWPQGIYISWIDPAGTSAGVGLQIGDILIAVENCAVTDQASFEAALSTLARGQTVSLTVFRDGEELTVSITVN